MNTAQTGQGTKLAESRVHHHNDDMTGMRAIGLAVVLALIAPTQTLAQTSANGSATDFDSSIIRSVISSQISAFLMGDNEQAFSFAAPSIKGQFSSVEQFVGMVKRQYQPVYAPKAYTFGLIRTARNEVVQQVFVTGPKGRDWIALYTLQLQSDGSWKISGCYIQPDESKGA